MSQPGRTGETLAAAFRLHEFLSRTFVDRMALVGPDPGVRLNWRAGRFVKAYLPVFGRKESLYYLQAQAYWTLANWMLFAATRDERFRHFAVGCSERMIENQRPDGSWSYPNPAWSGRIATAEGTWASIALLESFRNTGERKCLSSAVLWHRFLTEVVGFEEHGTELSVNYFAVERTARIPNNSAFVLRFIAELADVTREERYLAPCPGLEQFMRAAQKESGEFPYMVRGGHAGTKLWEHFQCFQYNAFQCLDLLRYNQLMRGAPMAAVIERCLQFLRTGIEADGHAAYACNNRHTRITYHAAALAAAFAMAGSSGFSGYDDSGRKMYGWLASMQRPDGSFGFSSGDYYLLSDRRAYPRPLAMVLYHLLVGHSSRLSSHPLEWGHESTVDHGHVADGA